MIKFISELFGRREISARQLRPWSKIEFAGEVVTVQNVAVCNGTDAPLYLMGSREQKTAPALLVSFMAGGPEPMRIHPGSMVRLAG
jgi:hypothetical protein